MGRKKEIVEVNELAVEAPGVDDAFMEDTAQEEEFDGRKEGLDPEMESGGEEPGDVADDADNSEEDTLADFMEEEDALVESAEDGEEMPEGGQMEESREHQDADGEDICENGEEGEVAVTDEASGLAENATEPGDVPAEIAAEGPAPAKPKRSSRKKKAVSEKAENEAETTGEQGDAEIGVQPEVEVQPETVPEEGLLEEALLSAEESDSEMEEDFLEFASMNSILEEVFGPYQYKYLNEYPEFEGDTSIEHLGEVFYGKVKHALEEQHWKFARFEISETPLRIYAIVEETF